MSRTAAAAMTRKMTLLQWMLTEAVKVMMMMMAMTMAMTVMQQQQSTADTAAGGDAP
jgi:F0F1-type ATP synthase assembly protein I